MMRTFVAVTISAATLFSSEAFTQEPSLGTASIPDFSGVWGNPYLYGIEPPPSGSGPVVNKSRQRQTLDVDGRPLPAANAPLVSDARRLVGDYTNPILKPEAAEVVKKHAEMTLAGVGYPSPRNQCWPQGVPFIFTNDAVQLLQQPDKITMLYDEDHEVRRVRMNQPHPALVTPSWYGDSVGHYEGDTLVIDTVGFKIGPFSAVDQYATPFTQALHVVERYRLIDYEAAKEAWGRGGKENVRGGGIGESWAPDPNYKGKALQLQLTVEDKGVFTTAWFATKTYRRVFRDWPENVCAENRTNTVPKKTLRSRLPTSRISESRHGALPSRPGQTEPSSFVTGTAELASIADARRGGAAVDGRPRRPGDRCSPRNRPPRRAAVILRLGPLPDPCTAQKSGNLNATMLAVGPLASTASSRCSGAAHRVERVPRPVFSTTGPRDPWPYHGRSAQSL